MTTESRLDQVELELEQMASRMRRLEREARVGETPPEPARAASRSLADPAPVGEEEWFEPPPPLFLPSRPRRVSGASFEELFGGQVLAWIGGLAILLGSILFMAMAISHGWLGEGTRTVIATLGSTALLGVGVWLHERAGRTEAARAAVASAISGLYGILFVAVQSYELISPGIGLMLAAVIAAVGFAIAVRWSSPIVAAIGSLGALGAPILVGAGTSGDSIAFVFLALAATVGILIWQRWDWLALGAFAVSAPQLIAWMLEREQSHHEGQVPLILAFLVGFWALYVVAAFGYELRSRSGAALPLASMLLIVASTALLVFGGYHALDGAGSQSGTVVWLFGCAAVYLLLGAIALNLFVQREVGSLLIATGMAISAFGLADALDGPALVISWAALSAALAYLATRLDASPDPAGSNAERMLAASGAFLALAVGHVLIIEAPLTALFEGVENLTAAGAAIAACAAAAFAWRCFARSIHPLAARLAAFAGAASLVYLGSILIVDTIGVDGAGDARQVGQVWLSAFWTATGLGAVVWGLLRRSSSVRLGGLALLAIAIGKVWTYDLAELEELARVLSFIGLGLLLLAGAFAYQRIKPGEGDEEREPELSA